MVITVTSLSNCSSVSSIPALAPSHQPIYPISSEEFWSGNAAMIWAELQNTPLTKLADMQSKTNDPIKSAWIQLAIISKQKTTNTQALANELIAWRERNPSHPANQLLPTNATLTKLQSVPSPERIAILLPQNGPYGAYGQIVREGFLNAYYANQTRTGKQNIKFYDTTQTQNIASVYQQAINDGADIVIGPLAKEDVQQIQGLGSLQKPTVALNYTEIHFGSLPTNHYQFGLLPEDEAMQIANRAYEAGRRQAIIIAPQTVWGKRLVSAFTSRWQSLGGKVQDNLYYNANTDFNHDIAQLLHVDPNLDKKLAQQSNNKNVLEQQRRHDFDVIFLFSQPQEARTIVPLLRYYHATDIAIYATSSVAGKTNLTNDLDLSGVIVCDIPKTGASNRLYAVGEDAYLLSQSLQRLVDLANFPLYGATGALILSPQHQIHRRLPCIPIQNV